MRLVFQAPALTTGYLIGYWLNKRRGLRKMSQQSLIEHRSLEVEVASR